MTLLRKIVAVTDAWREDLERRVAALERTRGDRAGGSATTGAAHPPTDDTFGLLAAFDALAPGGGAAVVGSVARPGGAVRWQYALADPTLAQLDWAQRAATIAALGSPVRLKLLQLIDGGVDASSELAARDDLGTTGQVSHHLRALVAAGWLESFARGRYRIPPARLVPLLAVLVAASR